MEQKKLNKHELRELRILRRLISEINRSTEEEIVKELVASFQEKINKLIKKNE